MICEVACNDEWCHPCKRTPPLRTTTLFVCSTSNESAPAMRLADGGLLFSIPSFGSALTLGILFPSSVVAVLGLINARYSISISWSLKEIRGQFNKVYFTSRTLLFTNSHQFKFTKRLYKLPLEASTCTYNGILLDQSVVSRKPTCALCSCKKLHLYFLYWIGPSFAERLGLTPPVTLATFSLLGDCFQNVECNFVIPLLSLFNLKQDPQ